MRGSCGGGEGGEVVEGGHVNKCIHTSIHIRTGRHIHTGTHTYKYTQPKTPKHNPLTSVSPGELSE